MAWSYRFRADDQLYADDEHGPTVFDPSASTAGAGTGNVSTAGTPTLNQVAIWQDGLHIAGFTLLPATCMPGLTGDITVAAGTTVTVYGNPVPVAKGGVPAGGATGQALLKGSNADYAVGWGPAGGVTDGDKGDIVVSSSGTVWSIDTAVVTYAKMQNVSAASILIGRGSAAGGGVPQEITLGTNLTMSGNVLNAAGGTGATLIASGTATLGTAAIASGAVATVVTVSAAGVLTTDVIQFTPNTDISAVTGYAPATTGGLIIYPYPTAGAVNFKVANPTAASITPGAVVLNWRVVR